MCTLCGVLGGDDHWTDPVARPHVYVRSISPVERRRERVRRISEANIILKLFGLSLEDWQGSSYVLRTATGKSEVIDNLSSLWPKAEKLSGQPCDPLDAMIVMRRGALND